MCEGIDEKLRRRDVNVSAELPQRDRIMHNFSGLLYIFSILSVFQ